MSTIYTSARGPQAARPSLEAGLAGADAIAAVWPDLVVPMTTYLAACGYAAPVEPAAAGRLLSAGDRLPFVFHVAGQPVIALLDRHVRSRTARMLILSPRGAEFEGVESVAGRLVATAFCELALRRCEWQLLRSWTRARAAATALAFTEEAILPEACYVRGAPEDLVIASVLAGEWVTNG